MRDWERRRALRASRRLADTELISTALAPPRLAWRTAELTAEANRRRLASSITDVVHAASERLLPGSSPIDRGAVREARAVLLELASRLYDQERRVQPRGVLLVERLLSEKRSPLFGGPGGGSELDRAAREALDALERGTAVTHR